MIRPQSVSADLSKSAEQKVLCQCGHQFNVDTLAKTAQCPNCKEQLNWGLRK